MTDQVSDFLKRVRIGSLYIGIAYMFGAPYINDINYSPHNNYGVPLQRNVTPQSPIIETDVSSLPSFRIISAIPQTGSIPYDLIDTTFLNKLDELYKSPHLSEDDRNKFLQFLEVYINSLAYLNNANDTHAYKIAAFTNDVKGELLAIYIKNFEA